MIGTLQLRYFISERFGDDQQGTLFPGFGKQKKVVLKYNRMSDVEDLVSLPVTGEGVRGDIHLL